MKRMVLVGSLAMVLVLGGCGDNGGSSGATDVTTQDVLGSDSTNSGGSDASGSSVSDTTTVVNPPADTTSGPADTTSGPADTTNTGGTGVDCQAIFGCLGNCGAEDEACFNNCVASGSADGQSQFLAIVQCLQAACPNGDEACAEAAFQNQCATQVAACEGSGGGGGTGGCAGAFNCVNGCTDEACAQQCLQTMSQASGQIWNAMVQCLTTACPDSDQACLETAFQSTCAQQVNACLADAGSVQ